MNELIQWTQEELSSKTRAEMVRLHARIARRPGRWRRRMAREMLEPPWWISEAA